ncbi:hypothetical protein VdG1_01048 [Verticillium dahliae VDG1]|nr:hypothetical protein VdG1_01048 [Verticillium dahliae VDG1]
MAHRRDRHQQPPSYQDAISRLDWLALVAPYVAVTDYPHLCSVNSHFCSVFAPRLWNDPLRSVRVLGLEPSHDLDWYFHFVFVRAPRTRPSVLRLVTVLDFRDFAKDNTQFSSDDSPKTVPETFRRLPTLFPRLRCILLDGHVEADPASLAATHASGGVVQPLLLSIADCDAHLSMSFFTSGFLRNIVYLDVSCLPGSLQGLLTTAQAPGGLPHLRILKAKGRELDDSAVGSLCEAFRRRLWSFDLSDNKLSNSIIAALSTMHAGATALRTDAHFEVEGTLLRSADPGDDLYGPFMFIRESDVSAEFCHPDRFFADAPAYYSVDGVYGHDSVRSDGRAPLRSDAAASIKTVLAGGLDHPAPDDAQLTQLDVCSAPYGLTHLDLTGNRLTSFGVDKLLRTTPGQLKSLACDAPLLETYGVPWPGAWPKGTKMYGILGSAHAFRPVFSSNLEALRIHHSFVTQIPTLETTGMSTMARLWFAETMIRDFSETAYPQAFVPDMNPRLTSLTLTKIPRRSVGPLTSKLTHFLRLAALQEQAIGDTSPSTRRRRRSPAVLRGIRHIRLEFETDPVEDPAGWSNEDDLDANRLMDMGVEEGFSFFQDENIVPKPKLPPRPMVAAPHMTSAFETSAAVPSSAGTGPSARLKHEPYTLNTSEYISHTLRWAGEPYEARVWIGNGIPGPSAAINAYMTALCDPTMRTGIVGPATPAHVKAGVPAGVLLFYAAWNAIVVPKAARTPSKAEVHNMHDVITALKAHRLKTRAAYETARDRASTDKGAAAEPHLFWSGKLEVVTQQSMAHYRSSRYWR